MLRAGGTVSTDHAGEIHITRASAPSSCDRFLPPRNQDGPTWRAPDFSDHHRYQILPQGGGGDAADLGGGKRKLPSPEGAVRQAALPQPQTGRERRGEEEWEEQRQLSRGREDGAAQISESHMIQERQEQKGYLREEGHFSDIPKIRAISGGKNCREGTVCVFFLPLMLSYTEKQPVLVVCGKKFVIFDIF